MKEESIDKNSAQPADLKNSSPAYIAETLKREGANQKEIELISREELEDKLNQAETHINLLNEKNLKLEDQVLRIQAEAQNVQKRLEKKATEATQFAIQGFAKELLGGMDNLERALADSNIQSGSLIEGIRRTHEFFLKIFDKFGLQSIDPIDDFFSPEWHEAISTIIAEHEHQVNKVTQVLQKGYLLNGRLIRPALVIVAKKS